MKRRVRGLLKKNWLPPLGAVLLVLIPLAIALALVLLLLRPAAQPAAGQLPALTFSLSDLKGSVLQLLFLLTDPSPLLARLAGWIPAALLLLGIHVFIVMPMLVAMAGYFLRLLRGKHPKVGEMFSIFSGQYPRILGAMAYRLLWQVLWFCLAFVLPTAAILASVPIVSMLGIELSTQITIFTIVIVASLLWYVAFFFVFLNRLLAYSLTPMCLAAQPRLPAHRAVRLSRKLMRGSKVQLILLALSFLVYFIPAILALLALLLLPAIGLALGSGVRIILWVIVGLNQLAWAYVAPYMAASLHAFYIERKREALMDEEVSPDDFGANPKEDRAFRRRAKAPVEKAGQEEEAL